MYNIKQFQELNKPELFILTQHGRKRLIERDITINDIVETINNGKIIEDYPNDFPFPSCLIFAKPERMNGNEMCQMWKRDF